MKDRHGGDVVKHTLLRAAGRKNHLSKTRRRAIAKAARRLSSMGVGIGRLPNNVIDLARHRARARR